MEEKRKLAIYKNVKAVKKKHEKAILRLSNVVGVGIGSKIVDYKATGEFCIRVYVKKKLPKSKLNKKDIIPKILEGVETDVLEVGEVQLYPYKVKHRPAHGGDSVGHKSVSAGTIGYILRDKTDGKKVILSNNHILANSDTDKTKRAYVGDIVTQPGPIDGGSVSRDCIATLKRWVEFVETGYTKVDAAIAELTNPCDASRFIHNIGCVDSWRSVTAADVILNPADPDNVQKTGRTTQYTTGKIIDDDATFWNGITYMTENIVTNDMAYFGDSGSLLVDMNKCAVGLLWGGSPGTIVIYSRIENVLDALNINFFSCKYIWPELIGPARIGIADIILEGIEVIKCKIGGPLLPPICLACGPDSYINCGSGGPDILVDSRGCPSGPTIEISVIDKRVNPKDILVIDKTKIPKGMQKSLTKMLESMAKER